jgi:asparagine synthase (glutamine-hydrolysing)
MCGIAGKVSKSFHDLEINNCLTQMKHRGPDDMGASFTSSNSWKLSLGQVRLSIIDLTKNGNQPFVSTDAKITLVYNGEIYNYKEIREYLIHKGFKFHTGTDTEVLLNAWIHWGTECLSKLKGMFAFAVHDQVNESLILVRDAFGMKPLFYCESFGSFSFASEISGLKSLISKNISVNHQRMFNYLAFGSQSLQNETFFSDIKMLEPGHFLRIDLSSSQLDKTLKRWWWPDVAERVPTSEAESVNEIRERFLDNVRLHLVSDVPIGATLSGGIDSSAIVCAMRHVDPNLEIKTFSYIAGEGFKSEEYWIDKVNKHVNGVAHKVFITPYEMSEDLDELIKYQGEPFGSTSIYAQYRVYKRIKDEGIKVALDGQGADELFAGYEGYPEWRVRSLISSGSLIEAMRFSHYWSKKPDRSLLDLIGKVISTNLLPRSFINIGRKIHRRPVPEDLFHKKLLAQNNINPEITLNFLKEIGWDRALAKRLRYALAEMGVNELLRYGDRNSMRWSVESRFPFLTTDFAETVLKLPERNLISNSGITKDIFRKAMVGIVPNEVLNRQDKIGFETPELEWLHILLVDVEPLLEGLSTLPWINSKGVKEYFSDTLSGRRKFTWQAWRLINAAKWSQLVLNN